MFGENFPYTNFHDLNMDWIIKIAKDFLDQYTHIQQIITDGETALANLTTEGLQQLQDKADNLEGLLQAWYNEHSEDIANQLADALSDLNNWYTEHEGYLDQYLADSISTFNTSAEAKARETLDSIPDDYTTLANKVEALDESVGTYFEFNDLKGYNLFDPNTVIDDSFISPVNGQLYPNTDTYKATDFIPINSPFLIIRSYTSFTNAGTNAAFYDKDKEYLTGMTVDDTAQWTNLYFNGAYYVKVDVPQTAKYFRYSALNVFFSQISVIGMYEGGIERYNTKYVSFAERLKIANMPRALLPAICASVGGEFNNSWNNSWLAPGFIYQMGIRSAIKGPQILSFFSIVSNMGELKFGFHGDSYCFHIDGTNIWYSANGVAGNPTPHNLTIQNYLNIIIELDEKGSTATIKINTNGGSAIFTNIYFIGSKGRPTITSVGYSGTYTQAGWCSKISRPIWMFGDSYFSSYSEKRWTHYLYEWGLDDNVVLDAYDGENSQQAMDDFTNMLYISIPKYAIWCMGMNDGDTTDINADWLSGVTAFITTCEANGITPILATIPNTPTVNNTYKNTWVRNSGYRYIDFANAVNADSAGATWFPGMREDNTHPSEQGAICLASEFVSSFPEIAIK